MMGLYLIGAAKFTGLLLCRFLVSPIDGTSDELDGSNTENQRCANECGQQVNPNWEIHG